MPYNGCALKIHVKINVNHSQLTHNVATSLKINSKFPAANLNYTTSQKRIMLTAFPLK